MAQWRDLSLDVLKSIVDWCHWRELLALEESSRGLRDLVRTSGDAVWERCFWREFRASCESFDDWDPAVSVKGGSGFLYVRWTRRPMLSFREGICFM
jgi:hypothetical protein